MLETIEKGSSVEIEILVDFHIRMFKEMFERKGKPFSLDTENQMKKSMMEKLQKEVPQDICSLWFVKVGDAVVSAGGMTLVSSVPTPGDPSYTIGYIHSLHTFPEYRGKGYASAILQKIIEHSRHMGLKRLTLNASDEGMKVYQKNGFILANNHFRYFL